MLCAIAVELTGRILVPEYLSEQALFEYEALRYVPDRRYRLGTPEFHHSIVINGDGFRDTARLSDLNDRDVVALGDSMTFGTGVAARDTFVKRLQLLLRTAYPEITVFNSGVGGQNPKMSISTYWQHLSNTNHGVVLLSLFARDDFVTKASADHFALGGNTTKDIAYYHWRIRSYLSEHSIIYALIKEIIFSSKNLTNILGRMGLIYNWRIPLWYDWPLNPESNSALSYTCNLIANFRSELAQRNRKLVVLILPTAMQVELSDSIPGTSYPGRGEEFDPLGPNREFASCLRVNDVDTHDLSLPMRQRFQKNRAPFFWSRDIHLNVDGHKFTASFISAHVQNLLPQIQSGMKQ